jgi:hypothetical protein
MAQIRLKHDPTALVFQQGDDSAKLHLLQLRDALDNKTGKDLLLNLQKTQMPSGGFPSRFDSKLEGVNETCKTTLLLLNCGIPHDKPNVQAAVTYLLRRQREDGGWSENPALTIPKQVTWLSQDQSITWLTADAIELLRRSRYGQSEACTKALQWLRGMQAPDGGWPMYRRTQFHEDPDSTAQILFLMREIYGETDPAWLKGVKKIEKILCQQAEEAAKGSGVTATGQRREVDIYDLTRVLISSLVDPRRRIDAGYDLSDPRVKKIVDAIFRSQLEDGGWRPFWSERGDPTYTVLTLKLLVWFEAIDVEPLRMQVLAHVQLQPTNVGGNSRSEQSMRGVSRHGEKDAIRGKPNIPSNA